MDELRDLYQEVILDHNRRPKNFHKIEDATHSAVGHNPLCGDQLTVYLKVDDDDTILDIGFQGSGCAISKASASIMTGTLKGKRLEEARQLFGKFHSMLTGMGGPGHVIDGKLAVFQGVAEFPARVKCASLAWHTVIAAMDAQEDPISTE